MTCKLATMFLAAVTPGLVAAIPTADVRTATAKSVALMQSTVKTWWEKQSCSSCHHQVLPALALRAAREHGVPVDEALARTAETKMFAYLGNLDRAVQYTHIIDPAPDDGHTLLAAHAAGVAPNLVTAVYARTLARCQDPDGGWRTIDARPPQSYSRFTSTALALRAMQVYSHSSMAAEVRERTERARRWLLSTPAETTEDRTWQLAALAWVGAEKTTRQKLAAALLAEQGPDGGWAQIPARSSDAYATGHALAVLYQAAGVTTSHPAYERGLGYLLKAQLPDGSWLVQSRIHPPAPVSPPYFESGYPHGKNQFISIMGTAWATIALSLALEPVPNFKMKPLTVPVDAEPWMETALFGSAADLGALLDRGLDPNSATRDGTTALMMAATDLDKVKLLVKHEADINARSKTRYTALMVAARHRGSAPVVHYLLSTGAEVNARPGAPSLFGASATFLAGAFSSEVEVVRSLAARGGNINHKMTLIGVFPNTAMFIAASMGDVSMVSCLLDLGADPNDRDGDNLTPLHWAVLTDRPEVSKLLIGRGAKIDAVDKFGMTPLLYAASIDFGNTRIIDLLLDAGANRDARSKEGATARELAARYNHAGILKRLD